MVEGSETRKPTISARVPQDTYDRIEAYCDDKEISKADALRRFVDDGLNRYALEKDTHQTTANNVLADAHPLLVVITLLQFATLVILI